MNTKNVLFAFSLFPFLFPLLLPAQSAPPRLLRDVQPGRGSPVSSNPTPANDSSSPVSAPFLTLGGIFYFSADDGVHGREIWSSLAFPGTARMVTDTKYGFSPVGPRNLTWFKGYLYFSTFDDSRGEEIWRSNGTPAGTYLFQDTDPGKGSGGFHRPFPAGGFLYYSAYTGTDRYVIFRYDGSSQAPEPVSKGFSAPWEHPVSLGKKILFLGTKYPGRTGLWVTDGTAGGTRLLVAGDSIFSFEGFAVSKGTAYFAFRGPKGWSIWKTDGTRASKLAFLDPRFGWGTPILLGTRLLFSGPVGKNGERDPWVLDTVTGKTTRLKKIAGRGGEGFLAPLASGKWVFFCARTGARGPAELWRTDGTPSGTTLVTRKGLAGGPWVHPAVSGGKIFFQGQKTVPDKEIWVTDGTNQGTRNVKDLVPGPAGSGADYFTPLSGGVAFAAWTNATGGELWFSDGTAKGTFLLQDLAPSWNSPSSKPSAFQDFFGRCFFSCDQASTGRELWVSGGTPGGTGLFKDIDPGPGSGMPEGLFTFRGKLFFIAKSGTKRGPWVSDGTPAGTRPMNLVVSDWDPNIIRLNNRAFLRVNDPFHGWEPWATDGTSRGTFLLVDTVPGVNSPPSLYWAGTDKEIFFSGGPQGNFTLWKTDCTKAGTVPVASGFSSCRNLIALGDKVLFEGKKGSSRGAEPWISDGTPGGTREILDLAPGFLSGGFASPMRTGNGVAFFGNDGLTIPRGYFGLFRTDGTAAGTYRIGSLQFKAAPSMTCPLGGKRALFWGWDDPHGQELWVTDGTARGTFLVADLSPGTPSTYPTSWTPLGERRVLFVCYTPSLGRELLVTDGTREGTRWVADLNPGPRKGVSGKPALSGGRVFFAGDDGSTGMEPWTWFPGATAQKIGWRTGKAELRGEDPVLGGSFRLTVTGLPPGTGGILLLGRPASRPLPLGGGAALFLDPPSRPFLGFPLGGGASLSFRLPGDPALIGARLAAQAVAGPTGTPPFHLDFTGGLFLTLGF